MLALAGRLQGGAASSTWGSSSIGVLLGGVFLGLRPRVGVPLGDSPLTGVAVGVFLGEALGEIPKTPERRRFWFLRAVLKLSCRSSVAAILAQSTRYLKKARTRERLNLLVYADNNTDTKKILSLVQKLQSYKISKI